MSANSYPTIQATDHTPGHIASLIEEHHAQYVGGEEGVQRVLMIDLIDSGYVSVNLQYDPEGIDYLLPEKLWEMTLTPFCSHGDPVLAAFSVEMNDLHSESSIQSIEHCLKMVSH